ncbi:MAG: hypothetical protein KatS3mg019_1963 [Fimbriimonadales bacterium]|nr:MAG: hypothetical protein KatS3mg019_1963 [Fimbriimonadales bacterium]
MKITERYIEGFIEVAGHPSPATLSTHRYDEMSKQVWLLSLCSVMLLLYYSFKMVLREEQTFILITGLILNFTYIVLMICIFVAISKEGLLEKVCIVPTSPWPPPRVVIVEGLRVSLVPVAMALNLVAYLSGRPGELSGISYVLFHILHKQELIIPASLHLACIALWLKILTHKVEVMVRTNEDELVKAPLCLIDNRAWLLSGLSVGFHAFAVLVVLIRWLALP